MTNWLEYLPIRTSSLHSKDYDFPRSMQWPDIAVTTVTIGHEDELRLLVLYSGS
jgi:hypothetical protein